jgi:photosynthetic reaction center cytochrome c subunit
MLEMTQHINADWKTHVARPASPATPATAAAGAGQGVVAPEPQKHASASWSAASRGQNTGRRRVVGLASLPYDPFTPYLSKAQPIRERRRPRCRTATVSFDQAAEFTYGLMMHMSRRSA